VRGRESVSQWCRLAEARRVARVDAATGPAVAHPSLDASAASYDA
jgi:hypothetical protein